MSQEEQLTPKRIEQLTSLEDLELVRPGDVLEIETHYGRRTVRCELNGERMAFFGRGNYSGEIERYVMPKSAVQSVGLVKGRLDIDATPFEMTRFLGDDENPKRLQVFYLLDELLEASGL